MEVSFQFEIVSIFFNYAAPCIVQHQKLKILTLSRRYEGEINLQQWLSIIENAPELEVIRTRWLPEYTNDGIVGIINAKTNLKKIVLLEMDIDEYNRFKNRVIIDAEWKIEGDVKPSMKEATFIRKNN